MYVFYRKNQKFKSKFLPVFFLEASFFTVFFKASFFTHFLDSVSIPAPKILVKAGLGATSEEEPEAMAVGGVEVEVGRALVGLGGVVGGVGVATPPPSVRLTGLASLEGELLLSASSSASFVSIYFTVDHKNNFIISVFIILKTIL